MQEEDSFKSAIVNSQRQHCRQQLSSQGTWLDDISVLQLFYHIAVAKQYSRKQVCLIDCCLLEAALYGRDDNREKNQGYLRREFREAAATGCSVIMIPLVGLGHWSLLCYRPRAQRWYHMDSMSPLHTRLSNATVAHLERLHAVPPTTASVERLTVKQQLAGWECGLYTLQYMIHVMESVLKSGAGNERTFKRELKLYNELACQENLLLFTQSLLKVI